MPNTPAAARLGKRASAISPSASGAPVRNNILKRSPAKAIGVERVSATANKAGTAPAEQAPTAKAAANKPTLPCDERPKEPSATAASNSEAKRQAKAVVNDRGASDEDATGIPLDFGWSVSVCIVQCLHRHRGTDG